MKRPCRQTGNSVERGANYAPATLCDRVGGIAVPGSGTACFSGGCTPPHRDCERPNTAKAMSETRQKNIPYRSSFEALGATEGDTGCGACRRPNKNAPQPEQHRAGTGRNRNSPQPERHRAGTGRTETVRGRNNTERERAKQKQPAAVTTPSGNEPKQKQPAAGTTPSGNGTNRNGPHATDGGGPSFGRHAQGIYRSATRCRGVLSGTTGESSSSSSSSMSVTSRPVSTPSV